MTFVPHQLLVHFPIALLTVYAVLELARHPRVVRSAWWFPVKSAFVLVGAASAVPTFLTGDALVEGMVNAPRIVEMHETFALATLVCFGVLAAAHLVSMWPKAPLRAKTVAAFVLRGWVAVPLALAGLAVLTVTGALGATMVFGPDIDPLARFLYDNLVR